MIKDENYYTIFGWMINRLHLEGNNLKIYALIYSFTQDGKTEYEGSIDYIKDFIGASRETVKRGLAQLEKSGYISKTVRNSEKGTPNAYKIVPLETAFAIGRWGVAQNDLPPSSNCAGGWLKMTSNNNIDNYIYKVSKKVSNKKKEIQSYDEIFEDFNVSRRLRESLVNFIRHSLANGTVIINDRLEGIIVALDLKYGKDEALKAQEVDSAISCGYKRLPCEGNE